jgi:Copper chaperone PCu(A)C
LQAWLPRRATRGQVGRISRARLGANIAIPTRARWLSPRSADPAGQTKSPGAKRRGDGSTSSSIEDQHGSNPRDCGHNNGDTPDRLTGCSADFARVEIHEMKTQNGVMTMPELKNGFDIPAHETVRFTPGGYHVMFNHLTKPLAKGYKVKATLAFEHAGGVEVEFDVEGLGASGPAPTKGDDMGGMKK